mgnify:CR=1 FL=1
MPAEVPPLTLTYPDNLPVKEKMLTVVKRFYGADGVDLTPEAEAKLALFELAGFGRALRNPIRLDRSKPKPVRVEPV